MRNRGADSGGDWRFGAFFRRGRVLAPPIILRQAQDDRMRVRDDVGGGFGMTRAALSFILSLSKDCAAAGGQPPVRRAIIAVARGLAPLRTVTSTTDGWPEARARPTAGPTSAGVSACSA